jgi:hypothetical protein
MAEAGGGSVPSGFTLRVPPMNSGLTTLANQYAPDEYSNIRKYKLSLNERKERGEISEKEYLMLLRSGVTKFQKKEWGNQYNNQMRDILSEYYQQTPEEEKAQWAAYTAQAQAELNADPYVQAQRAALERASTITTNPMFNQQRQALRRMIMESEAGGRRSSRHRRSSRRSNKSRKFRKHKYTRRH